MKGRTHNLRHIREWHGPNYDIIRKINGQKELKLIKIIKVILIGFSLKGGIRIY